MTPWRTIRAAAACAGVVLVALTAVLAATGASARSPARPGAAQAQAPAPLQLPRGGRRIFPDFRVVAFYGAPQHRNLGVLGIGSPDAAAAKLRRQALAYRAGPRPVLPGFELLATIALAGPGADGRYRGRQPARVIDRYLRAARRARAILVLDIQPGRSDFMTEARRLERWLRQPDVSLAIDPEWNMGPRGIPGRSIGHVSAGMVNRVSAYLGRIVRHGRLPQKLLVVHKFTDSMIRPQRRVIQRRDVAVTINVDGVGGRAIKLRKYRDFTRRRDRLWDGFKLFYEEDTDLITPRQVLALRPSPRLVVYE